MSKEKHKCESCIHYDVCEWAVEETYCSDYIAKQSFEIIQAMAVIKSYCSTHDNCNVCPMQCNCYTDSLTSLYPDNWNIPS